MQSKKFFKSNSLFNKLLFGLKKNSSRKNYTAVNKESAVSSDNKNLSAIRNVIDTTEIVRLTFNSVIDEQAKQVYILEKILYKICNKKMLQDFVTLFGNGELYINKKLLMIAQ